jgi:hypothetical protein
LNKFRQEEYWETYYRNAVKIQLKEENKE